MVTELWLERVNLRNTKVVSASAAPLEKGQIRAAIGKFALTANNVSYAICGDSFAYWQLYPAADKWGQVPVWGFANVEESAAQDIAAGERLYGFFPMASHATLLVGSGSDAGSSDDHFIEASPHRATLPTAYNLYRRVSRDPAFSVSEENARCLLYPLLLTAYFLSDYFHSHNGFGARQVIIGSVSSKTGLGLARFLSETSDGQFKVVGLTSADKVRYVEGTGLCDQVLGYGDELAIDPSLPTAWFDISGNARLTETLHRHLGDNIYSSCLVGFTHWEQLGELARDLPGARPEFFFAPTHIAKRDAELGAGVLLEQANRACARTARSMLAQMEIETACGSAEVATIWRRLLDNGIPPHRGIIARIEAEPSARE